MKKLICTSIFAVLAAVATVSAQNDPKEYLGLPGDNLNLYAVMNLFQESETLEAFEKNINDENSRINNLDLNGDNMVDYITVTDYVDGDVHTIVLRTALSRNEYQDLAVFTVEKLRNGAVQIQLIGDEALYGRNYIVEPIYAETPNPGYKGRTVYRDNVTVVTTTYYEVAAWPVIRFIYNPYYVSWRSSWYWGYYPVYWNPWRPYYYHYYYGYHSNWYPHYYSHYRHWHQPRYYGYNDYYYRNVRAYSPNVSRRITEGHYKQTYSRPETRRDGEALYASTSGTRRSSARPAASTGTDRRSPAATGSSSRPAASTGTDRRSPATASSRSNGSQYSGQNGEVRRSTSDVVKSAPASSTRSSSTPEATRQSTTQRSQSTVQRSSQAPAQRSQSTAQRAQSTVQRSSQAPAQRSQSTVQRSQSSGSRSSGTVQKSSPSVSQRSSAPAARSQSSSGSSAPAARSQSSSRSSAPAARSQS
ncbi:MAG: hypothetical protein LC630_02995, partial [Bacteroidales bacterium]|nr:hypothetical protein [Bacteroidales bacterium]